MVGRRNHLLYHTKYQSTSTSPFLRDKILFKKLTGGMLNELIIKFELMGLGAPGRICTSATGYFYDKTKISKKNLRVYIIYR